MRFQNVTKADSSLTLGASIDIDTGIKKDTEPCEGFASRTIRGIIDHPKVHYLERTTRNGFQLFEIRIVPPRIGRAGNEPRATIVCDERPIPFSARSSALTGCDR